MASDLRTFAIGGFQTALDEFIKDIDALSHEDLNQSYGNGSRCAYDFVYEVGIINQRVAKRCKAEDPGPMPWNFGQEWLKAPEEFKDKERAMQHIKATGEELLAAVGDDMDRVVTIGEDSAPVYQRVSFATLHTSYHDAQLNFIQSLKGDMAIHW